jgi:hypothetical protein
LNLAFFVAAQDQRVIGRGFRYRPTMSPTFSIRKGSLESLKLPLR